MSNGMAAMSLMSVASSAFAGHAQNQQGQQQQAAYDYNAAVALENMRKQEQASADKFSELEGKQRSLYAKAGVSMASGSPLLELMRTASQGAEEFTNINEAGTRQSQLDTYYGQMAAYSGNIGGTSQFLTGLSHAGMTYAQAGRGLDTRVQT